MTVEIDGKKRARYNGFFQTDMYIPSEMLVFQVACGAPGSGGDPNLGLNHTYTLRARDSAGLGAANYGSVTCPADEPRRIFFRCCADSRGILVTGVGIARMGKLYLGK